MMQAHCLKLHKWLTGCAYYDYCANKEAVMFVKFDKNALREYTTV